MKRMVTILLLASMAVPMIAVADEIDEQILGPWQLSFTAPDGVEREPVVLVGRQYDKHAIWYIDNDQRGTFKNVRLEDDTLSGTMKPQDHPGVTVTLAAKLVSDDRCEGTATYQAEDGETGSWEFAGKRLAMSSFDEVQTWTLKFTTPDYEQHSPEITVISTDGETHAWYSGKNHEVPAEKLNVDDDRVEMKISASTSDGGKVVVTFRGTVDGETIKGSAEYNVDGETGTFPFSGQRKS